MRRGRAGWLIAGALAGCDAAPPTPAPRSPAEACRQVHERQLACAGPEERADLEDTGESRVEHCTAERLAHPEDYDALLGCAELAECEAFQACLQTVEHRLGRRARMVRISESIRYWRPGSGSFGASEQALGLCFRDHDEDPEFGRLCEELYAVVLAAIRTELEELRDGPGVVRCSDLHEFAQRMSNGEEVRVLCEEVDAAREANMTGSHVALAKSYGTEQVPVSCAATVGLLERLGTPWAKRRREEVITECYAEYGASLLPMLRARKRCREIEELYRHLRPRAAEDAALAKSLAKAVGACPQAKEAK